MDGIDARNVRRTSAPNVMYSYTMYYTCVQVVEPRNIISVYYTELHFSSLS
jgi:hypothetical protein